MPPRTSKQPSRSAKKAPSSTLVTTIVPTVAPSAALATEAAPSVVVAPQRRIISLRKKHCEVVKELLHAAPCDSDAAPATQASSESSAKVGLGASENALQYATMLRAIYVVTFTEKAQLKLRLKNFGADGQSTETPSNVPQQQRLLPGNSSTVGYDAEGRTLRLDVAEPIFHGANARPLRQLPLSSPGRPGQLAMSRATPPPSPSRWLSGPYTQPSPRLTQPQVGDSNSSAAGPVSLMTAADGRWRAAVAQFVGRGSFTLDHVARIAALFPQHLRVAWSAVSHQPASTQSDFVANALAPHLLDSALFSSSSAGSSINSYAVTPDVLRGRVTLLRQHIPSISDITNDLDQRGGAQLVASVVSTTALEQFRMEQLECSKQPPELQPKTRHSLSLLSESCGADVADDEGSAVVVHHVSPPLPFSFDGAVKELVGGAPKRQREDPSAKDADLSHTDDDDSSMAAVPEALRAYLSVNKLHQVRSEQSESRKKALQAESSRIYLRQQAEKLLGVYDLVRIVIGPLRSSVGGLRLVKDVTLQNRFGASEEEVVRMLWRLIHYAASGLSIQSLDGETYRVEVVEQEGTADAPHITIVGEVERLSEAASSQLLKESIVRLDQSARRAQLQSAITSDMENAVPV